MLRTNRIGHFQQIQFHCRNSELSPSHTFTLPRNQILINVVNPDYTSGRWLLPGQDNVDYILIIYDLK